MTVLPDSAKIEWLETRLAHCMAKLHAAERDAAGYRERVEFDYLRSAPLSAPLVMWVVAEPRAILAGSLFFHRRYAIDYAETVTGIKWRKLRRMGYRCEKTELMLK